MAFQQKFVTYKEHCTTHNGLLVEDLQHYDIHLGTMTQKVMIPFLSTREEQMFCCAIPAANYCFTFIPILSLARAQPSSTQVSHPSALGISYWGANSPHISP